LSGPTRYQRGTAVTAIDSFTKPLTSFRTLDAVDTTAAYTAKASLAHDTGFLGGRAEFKAGFQYDSRTKKSREAAIMLATAAQFTAVGLPTDYHQFSQDNAFVGALPMGYTFRYFDPAKMRAASAQAQSLYPFTDIPANDYKVREDVVAGFVMGTVNYDW